MVKAKPVGKTGVPPKLPLKSVKQSAIQKKKNPKFKNTPTGKVNLINGSNMQNTVNMKSQKQFAKGKSASPMKSPKQQGGQKGFSKAKNINTKKEQSLQSANGKRKIVKDLVPKDEESDSDEDYNEGIVIREEISMVDEDDIDDEEESDDDVPDIFGTSLADDSDEDDDDFDDEDSDEDEAEEEDSSLQKKGIKMFTGVKSNKGADLDNSSDSATLNTSTSSAQNSSFMTNDDYDEDDEQEDGEDSEDTDEEAEDSEDEGEDEDEDDSDEDEEEDEEEESGPGLKALLGNSLADDDDDEDFDGEEEDSEDEDISDEEDDEGANNSIPKTTEKTQNKKKAKQAHSLRVDESSETNVNPKKSVFLGNLSFKADNNAIWEHFKDCGDIESVRIIKRNNTGMGKGIGYINFKNEDSVALALKLDGTQLANRAVRVRPYTTNDPSSKKPKQEGKKRPLPQGSSSKPKKIKASPENLEQHNEKSLKKKGSVSENKQSSPQKKGAFQGQKLDAKKKKPSKLEKQTKVMAAKLTSKSKKSAH